MGGSGTEAGGAGAAGAVAAADVVAACAEAARAGELAVFADFDRTVTRCLLPSGGRVSSAHGVLEQAGVLSEAFRGRCSELFAKYYPVEIDPQMAVEDKIPIMSEWYGSVHELMVKENVTRESIGKAVEDCSSIMFRDGMEDFLRACQEAQPPVPVFIMSAGLKNVIEEILRQRLSFELAPTTVVVSNGMLFDDMGHLAGFSEPLIHMFNKSAAFLPEDVRPLLDGRRRCLLLGDSLGDLTMAQGLDLQTLKVGFLNEKVEEWLKQYNAGFDHVVTHDGPVPDACFQALGLEVPGR